VRIAKGGCRVQWLLLAVENRLQGQGDIPFYGGPNTVLLQAIVKGLQEAAQLAGSPQAELTVVSNYEYVIKQARGEVKIKNEQDRVLFETIHSLKPKYGSLLFIVKPGSEIKKYFKS